ncbi:hypothetical protein V8E53_015886 [Lactarius tabidus]
MAECRNFTVVGIILDSTPGVPREKAEYWEHSKRLQQGSLVALALISPGRFQAFLGTIIYNGLDVAESAKADEGTIQLRILFFDAEIELMALRSQAISVDQCWLDLCNTRAFRSSKYNLQCLARSLGNIISGLDLNNASHTTSVAIARQELIPSSTLDPSQGDAVIGALSLEASLIQGNGKDHALDHILPSVPDAKITKSVVCLGSRTTDEHIEQYSLFNLEQLSGRGDLDGPIRHEYAALKREEGETKHTMNRRLAESWEDDMRKIAYGTLLTEFDQLREQYKDALNPMRIRRMSQACPSLYSRFIWDDRIPCSTLTGQRRASGRRFLWLRKLVKFLKRTFSPLLFPQISRVPYLYNQPQTKPQTIAPKFNQRLEENATQHIPLFMKDFIPKVVQRCPDVRGMNSENKVFFFSHNPKNSEDDLVLKRVFEGPYDGAGDIAILFAYPGQLQQVHAALNDLKIAIRIGKLRFISSPARPLALYILGNASNIGKNETWRTVLDEMDEEEHLRSVMDPQSFAHVIPTLNKLSLRLGNYLCMF